jgi:hypothetical protein
MSEQNKIKHTTQAMFNMSFDDELKVNMVEIMGEDGLPKNPATEETLVEIKSQTDKLKFDGEKLKVDAAITTGDIEIGAVEIKNGADDTRAVVGANGLEVEVKAIPSITVSNPTANPETGLATSAKQDVLLTELQLKADKTEEQSVHDAGSLDALTRILEQVSVPIWYDAATNSLKAVVTGSVTATVASTTVTSEGGIPSDPLIPSLLNMVWANSIRNNLHSEVATTITSIKCSRSWCQFMCG